LEEELSLLTILRKLGFPDFAAKVYLYILEHGEVSLFEIVREFQSIDDVQNSLRWLEERRVILRRVDAAQNEHFIPIHPQIVARALYSRFLWEHVPSEEWLSTVDQKSLNSLMEYRRLCDLFSKKFTPIYLKSTRFVKPTSGLEMIPGERLPNVLSFLLSEASEEILGITVFPWTPSIELIWETLKEKMRSGVRYRRIGDEITFIAFGYLINFRDVFEVGVNLRILLNKEISEKFYVVDNRKVFVFFPTTPPPNFALEGMVINGGPLIREYKETFEYLWQRAIPASKLMKYMEVLKKDFLKKIAKDFPTFTTEEKDFIEGLVDYGKFYRFKYTSLPCERATFILNLLAEKNYLVPFPDSEIGFIPNLAPSIRKFIEKERGK
jgi:hypothetical protein